MKRTAEDEQQEVEAAAAKRVKTDHADEAAAVKEEPNKDANGDAAGDQLQPEGAAVKQEGLQKQEQQQHTAQPPDAAASEEEDDAPIQLPVSTTRSAVRKGHECPYLDTILRQVRAELHLHHAPQQPS